MVSRALPEEDKRPIVEIGVLMESEAEACTGLQASGHKRLKVGHSHLVAVLRLVLALIVNDLMVVVAGNMALSS